MCTKKFLKVFGLLLVVGLLFAVAPTGQALAQTPTGYEFVQREAGTAAISTEQFYSSNSSVKFTTGEVLNNNDAAMIRFKFPDGFTLDELTALNYWEYVDTRENDLDIFLDIWLDFNGDGVATTDDYPGYMQAEPYYVQGAAPLDTWTYVDGMTLKWSTLVGPDDPYNAPTIAQLQANTVPTWTNNVDFGQLDILQIDIRVGYGYPTWNNFIGYADDITINGHVESFPPNEVWVCPTGSCGHTGAEFSTIQGGINAVAAGGTVNVAAGVYNENLTINKALTLQGAGDELVTVNGVAPTTDAGMLNIVASDVTIDGFKFVGQGLKTVRLNAPSTNVTFSNNTVIGAEYDGVGAWDLFTSNYNNAHSDLTITGNVFENNGGQIGVYLNPQITGLTFTNNTFQGDPTSGPVLGIDGMLGTEVITGNTFNIDSTYALFEGFGTVPIVNIFNANTWPAGYIASGKMVVPASVVYPSTNDNNRTQGWAHVDFVSADATARTMTFNFIQTRNFGSCVEYRTNTQTTPTDSRPNYNPEILDGMWTFKCLYAPGNTPITITLDSAATYVEFRLSFGAEKDERFYWTPFTFVPEVWVDDSFTEAEEGFGITKFLTIQEGIDAVAAGGTVNVAAGTYNQAGGILINEPGITVKLGANTVIQNNSPCFTVNASFTKIYAQPGAKCIPVGGANGIDVAAGLTDIRVAKLEINGTGQSTGDGIHFAGAINNLMLLDNYIHDMPEDGVEFVTTPTGEVDIQGNLFENNVGLGINAPGSLNAEYNSWGDYDGPDAAAGGDGISIGVDAAPWTHADVYMVSSGSPWANQVVKGQTITYTIKGNLQNVNAADITFSYPEGLTVSDSGVITTSFDSEAEVAVDAATRTITYHAVSTTGNKTGLGLDMFWVKFTAGSTMRGIKMDIVDGSFGFGGLTYTNNVYLQSAVDGSITVIDLPTLTSEDIGGPYLAGVPQDFHVMVKNPAAGGNFVDSIYYVFTIANAELEDIYSLVCDGNTVSLTESGDDLIGRTGYDGHGFPMPPDGEWENTCTVNFKTAKSYDFSVDMVDNTSSPFDPTKDIQLVNLTATATVNGGFAITGTFSMQGRLTRGGIPVTLGWTGTEWTYSASAATTDVMANNFNVNVTYGGGYLITTLQPRYLNITTELAKSITVNGAETITPALMLRGGNVVNADTSLDKIDLSDAGLIGGAYGDSGNPLEIAADANFDGKVNILDLALVGGNFELTPATAYTDWVPVTVTLP